MIHRCYNIVDYNCYAVEILIVPDIVPNVPPPPLILLCDKDARQACRHNLPFHFVIEGRRLKQVSKFLPLFTYQLI